MSTQPEIIASSTCAFWPRVAIVVSRFNEVITDALLQGALDRFEAVGMPLDRVTVVQVPGAVEIPTALQQLANKEIFHGLIALGAVVYGETPHFDYVCQWVTSGCQRIALDRQIPVIFGVLTTNTQEQALARVGGHKGHMGIEAADALLAMVSVIEKVQAIAE
ncbi:MAG: 6,7-dimethyl-8-ribityllumazine synthase [Gammaproteobacteria bacterium]